MVCLRRWDIDSSLRREWEMTPLDVALWDTLLSSVLKAAGTQGVTGLEVLNRVANEMMGKLYVLEITTTMFSRLTMYG